ncbi:MAG: hypothetical protein JXA60_11335 [Candidatus Coatesbacteria bacterium]|nr:hypothetical protein [Candidatus Coatesbacteria bacterium]
MECKSNKNDCPCTYVSCSKHGICCECIRSHRMNDELPACYFSKEEELTYDRSISYFINQRRKK